MNTYKIITLSLLCTHAITQAACTPASHGIPNHTPANNTKYDTWSKIEELAGNNASVNKWYKNNLTLLMYASEQGNRAQVESLLEIKTNPNIQNKYGLTALMAASPDPVITQLLIDAKASPDMQDPDGDTALHRAITLGHLRRAIVLCAAGANPCIRNNKGLDVWDSMHATINRMMLKPVTNPQLSTLSQNITQRAEQSINHAQQQQLNIALLDAAREYRSTATQLLLNASAKIDACDSEGNTALHLAVQHGHNSAITALIKAGATPFAPYNKDKKAPYDYADAVTSRSIAHALQERISLATQQPAKLKSAL